MSAPLDLKVNRGGLFEIVRYSPDLKAEWDAFVSQSKNGTFLFFRDYMDYHSDRFADFSLMFYLDGRLFALLPANRESDALWSHHGLTYGGLIMSDRTTVARTQQLFLELNVFLQRQRFNRVVYKHIPWVYASIPSEEDLYALSSVCHASIKCRNVSSVVQLSKRLPLSTLRKRGLKRAQRADLTVQECADFATFWQLLESHLLQKYNARPIHTLSEISLLKKRFSDNIRLYTVCHGNELLGGTVLYVDGRIAKTQYISASETGQKEGALDLLFYQLMEDYSCRGLCYFDYGTSNLVGSDALHESLIFQKEGFGGRAVCYDTYEWNLSFRP